MSTGNLSGREVIVEFRQVGQIVKATALDVKTLTEVSIQGPVSAGNEALKRNAIRRLEYVLKRDGVV